MVSLFIHLLSVIFQLDKPDALFFSTEQDINVEDPTIGTELEVA